MLFAVALEAFPPFSLSFLVILRVLSAVVLAAAASIVTTAFSSRLALLADALLAELVFHEGIDLAGNGV